MASLDKLPTHILEKIIKAASHSSGGGTYVAPSLLLICRTNRRLQAICQRLIFFHPTLPTVRSVKAFCRLLLKKEELRNLPRLIDFGLRNHIFEEDRKWVRRLLAICTNLVAISYSDHDAGATTDLFERVATSTSLNCLRSAQVAFRLTLGEPALLDFLLAENANSSLRALRFFECHFEQGCSLISETATIPKATGLDNLTILHFVRCSISLTSLIEFANVFNSVTHGRLNDLSLRELRIRDSGSEFEIPAGWVERFFAASQIGTTLKRFSYTPLWKTGDYDELAFTPQGSTLLAAHIARIPSCIESLLLKEKFNDNMSIGLRAYEADIRASVKEMTRRLENGEFPKLGRYASRLLAGEEGLRRMLRKNGTTVVPSRPYEPRWDVEVLDLPKEDVLWLMAQVEEQPYHAPSRRQ
ncbi:hypothetical protein BT69DRAFT_1358614 [Atractiella rhizophila]|nr:hypothetical protein BT69DRAFT_1358614 [Atractiella rhizophila]